MKSEAFNYLKQAEEFLLSAKDNLNKERYNAAGFDATQAIINANDALTVYFLERRASTNHREALRLHIDVVKVINDSSQRNTIKETLEMRSTVGYLGTPISKKDAQKLLKSAVIFIEWIRRYLK